jgi:hypothetical protein
MAPTQDQRQGFAAELRAVLDGAGRSQSWLGAEIARLEGSSPVAQPQISRYLSGESTPEPDRVFVIERVLGLRPGTLSALLGYLPADSVPAVTVADAAAGDTALTVEQREDLVAVWETMRGRTLERRGR